MFRCEYCQIFSGLKIVNPGSKKGEPPLKKCKISRRKVDILSDSCKFFNPVNTFHCDKYQERYFTVICVHRRYKAKSQDNLKPCLNCKQFDFEIKPIIEKYYIDASPVVEPPKPTRLAVRRKKVETARLSIRRDRKVNRDNRRSKSKPGGQTSKKTKLRKTKRRK